MDLKDCPEREIVDGGHACQLVREISSQPLSVCTVGEDACRFCCQQEERPTVETPNVVVTSALIHTARKSGDESLQSRVKRLHIQAQKGFFSKAGDYLKARDTWAKAGKPLRSKERIQEIFSICTKCDHYLSWDDEGGQCGICGCWLYPTVSQVNKIQWATERCPLIPPKWAAEIEAVSGSGGETTFVKHTPGVLGFFDHLKNRGKARLTVSGVKPLNQKELLRLNTIWVVQESMRDEGRGLLVLDARVTPPVGGVVLLQVVVKKTPTQHGIVQAGFLGAMEIKFRTQEDLPGRKVLLSVHEDDKVRDLDLSRASIRVEIL